MVLATNIHAANVLDYRMCIYTYFYSSSVLTFARGGGPPSSDCGEELSFIFFICLSPG